MSDELEWRPDLPVGTDESYVADRAWDTAFSKRDYYRVYQWKDGWAYSRPDHSLLGGLQGRVKTLKKAKAACQADYELQARLQRWLDYMLITEPPEQR